MTTTTAAVQQKPAASVTLQADDGTVTLEGSEISSASGTTPLGSASGGLGSATMEQPGGGGGGGRRSGSAGKIGGEQPSGTNPTMRNGDGSQRDNDHNSSAIDLTARDGSGTRGAGAVRPPMQAPGHPRQTTQRERERAARSGATHVRGHRPKALDEVLNVAIPQVGDYGEGYGIGVEEAMSAWDAREAARGRGPLATPRSAAGGHEKSAVGSSSWSVVTGYDSGWGVAPKPPRYESEGRLVEAGKASTGE
ncbi:unnamed protein product [Phytophthora fragariaefolia]|uniref:Unnamed protein product n=1 Tax=Phytophthora fragariaefolia TaxID=1490495 RepID=A0A9W6UAV4_9STRA|nr:unnamed protein product [Phytophthora fragariaefolia]